MDDPGGISIKYHRERFARSVHYSNKWLPNLTRITTACPHTSIAGTILGKEEHAQFSAVDTGFKIRPKIFLTGFGSKRRINVRKHLAYLKSLCF